MSSRCQQLHVLAKCGCAAAFSAIRLEACVGSPDGPSFDGHECCRLFWQRCLNQCVASAISPDAHEHCSDFPLVYVVFDLSVQ